MNLIIQNHFSEGLYTLIFFFVFIAIYTISSIFIRNMGDWSIGKKHRVSITIRNILIVLFAFIFLSVWSGELKTFLLSATALAGALFIVFKEIILSITGGFLISNGFAIGDNIRYNGIEGVIVDKTLLYTKVSVNDVYNNKEILLPNMLFITNTIENTSNYGKFNVFKIEVGAKDTLEAYEQSKLLLPIAESVLMDYRTKYFEYFKDLKEKQKGQFLFEVPTLNPKITYHFGDMKKIYFTVHFVAHPNEKEEIENKIYELYFKKKNVKG